MCNCGYKNHTEQDCCADGLVCSSDGPNEFYRCKLGLGETCKATSDCASHIYHRTVECQELVNGPGLFECCIPAVGFQAGFSCKIGFKKSKYLQAIVVLWALEPRHRTDVCKTNLKHTIWEVFFRCFQVRRSWRNTCLWVRLRDIAAANPWMMLLQGMTLNTRMVQLCVPKCSFQHLEPSRPCCEQKGRVWRCRCATAGGKGGKWSNTGAWGSFKRN